MNDRWVRANFIASHEDDVPGGLSTFGGSIGSQLDGGRDWCYGHACVIWAGHQVPYPIHAAMTAVGLIVKFADGYCLAGR